MVVIREIYIHKYILETIIKYIYNRSRFNNIVQNNELIQYGLVCKSFFNLVSKIISSYITTRNFEFLKSLMQTPRLRENNQEKDEKENNNDEKYKLIKLENAVFYYFDYEDYLKAMEIYDLSKNHIKIGIYGMFNSFPQNDKLKFKSLELENFLRHSNNKENDSNMIKTIRVAKKENLIEALKLNFQSIQFHDYSDNRFYIFCRFKANENHKIDLDDLYLPDGFVENSQGRSLSTFKKYYVKISVNNLLKTLKDNLCDNDIRKSWEYIIDKFKNSKTLTEIICFHNCQPEECNCHFSNGKLSKTIINNGLISIISSNITNNLKFLRFSTGEFDEELYESIAKNQTIRDLSIDADCLPGIIKNVLIKNKTIRNLIVDSININGYPVNIVKSLKLLSDPLYINQIDLYSISFLTQTDNLDKYIKLLTPYNFNIKEFNFCNTNFINIDKTYRILFNNSIINIENNHEIYKY